MHQRRLIVTHHAPDLDAIGSVWLLKRFDAQHYADAKVFFVNPGDAINSDDLSKLEIETENVTHVDTGLGEFDHHQKERAQQHISASSLVYDYLCRIHPDLKTDSSLKKLTEFITGVDHFEEIHWPDTEHYRYSFMIDSLIRGLEFTDPHDDDSQLHFGMTALDCAYASLKQHLKAEEIIAEKGQDFELSFGRCLALDTRNDDTLKLGQKQGFALVLRKDTKKGHIRIKARPDANVMLDELHKRILEIDSVGTWFYHQSGKMLINGSRKHQDQKPSPLSLRRVVDLIKELYG